MARLYVKDKKHLERLKNKCFVCGKTHLYMAGTLRVEKLFYYDCKAEKKIYLISRRALMYCWLKRNKKVVLEAYKENEE